MGFPALFSERAARTVVNIFFILQPLPLVARGVQRGGPWRDFVLAWIDSFSIQFMIKPRKTRTTRKEICIFSALSGVSARDFLDIGVVPSEVIVYLVLMNISAL